MAVLGILAILLALGLVFEGQYRRRPGNCLQIGNGKWEVYLGIDRIVIEGQWLVHNPTDRFDLFLADVTVTEKLLSQASLVGISTRHELYSQHPDQPRRYDNYWEAYIVKAQKSTEIRLRTTIEGVNLDQLQACWLQLHAVIYGPGGRTPKTYHMVVPLQFPHSQPSWRRAADLLVMPIRTHLLSAIDDPVAVIERYVLPYAEAGDIVTIGETPVAIMQGRWRHPSDVQPGWLAKRLCYYFLPTSSLATACGLQVLVDEVGAWRVFFAFVVGGLAKVLLRRPGVFYELAGEQARLIDDVTGTLPPYDQFIVLGPRNAQAVVNLIKEKTGLETAIVDVNDLGGVKIVAHTPGADPAVLERALKKNPAGNANEQTPIVLIRPQA
ncbi:MAG: F420-0:Gamma-glutamyl ligase [Pseudanabaenaceae cyanobacterium SKYGB_i_bin29]|nr:coenzyme F420-0:L-glutamate ligase [Pseudanabaenaceae cyanobacterium SKYG29]MDW8421040.1 F420-0:Gamma-glutamyl ligase [Pseudanabaenaceae cyanobacterium SKYGB_i_bin29]